MSEKTCFHTYSEYQNIVRIELHETGLPNHLFQKHIFENTAAAADFIADNSILKILYISVSMNL